MKKIYKAILKKQPAGSKAIIVEVILLLLAVTAVLIYKTNLIDMVQEVVTNCKEQITTIIK